MIFEAFYCLMAGVKDQGEVAKMVVGLTQHSVQQMGCIALNKADHAHEAIIMQKAHLLTGRGWRAG